MDYSKYIGFKMEEVLPILEENRVKYNIIEVWDNKNTKMGPDQRIINIKPNDIIEIFTAYF